MSVCSSSRAGSPAPSSSKNIVAPVVAPDNFLSLAAIGKHSLLPDNISLSSVGSSEMSRSDPALNYDSGSTAYESEYDNYRPGMASDEDYFIPEPISDMEIDMFDDINVDDVEISDTYQLGFAPALPKMVTDV